MLPSRLLAKAMRRPSGDQEGALFSSPLCGKALRSSPALLRITSSGSPLRYDMKTISLPSGDQAGDRLIEPLPVTRLARAPS